MQETVIWTALPNGRSGNKLRLSAFASIRLTGNSQLAKVSDFPTAANWDPAKLSFEVHVQIAGGAPRVLKATVVSASTRGMWQAYFPSSGPVISYGYVPQAQESVSTLHSQAVGQYLAEAHSRFVASGFMPHATAEEHAKDAFVTAAASITPPPPPPATKVDLSSRVAISKLPAIGIAKSATSPTAKSINSQALQVLRKSFSPPTDLKSQLDEAKSFFQPVKSNVGTRLPSMIRKAGAVATTTAPAALPNVDFHQALSMLGQHPVLMRQVGVVFDLEVDWSDAGVPAVAAAPVAPATKAPFISKMAPVQKGTTVRNVRVKPSPAGPVIAAPTVPVTDGTFTSLLVSLAVSGMPASPACTVNYPVTTCRLTSSGFDAAPRSTLNFIPMKAGLAGVRFQEMMGDVVSRFMNMSPDKVALGTFDLHGALHKMGMMADKAVMALSRSENVGDIPSDPDKVHGLATVGTDKEEGYPSYRSAGISVFRINRSAGLQAQRASSDQHNANLNSKQPVVLFADDLFRGWRPDIFHNNKWRSLNQRLNTYSIYTTPGSASNRLIVETSDESNISSAFTQDPGTSDHKVNESLFTWEGWSLAASKPGKVLDDQGQFDISHPQTPDAFKVWANNPANVDRYYSMVSFAKPQPGTLPTMRFGQTYKIRARAVDLAGNSLPVETPTPVGPLESPDTVYLRYDPILSPLLFAKDASIGRGASNLVLVIRKYKGKPTTETTYRHVVPTQGGEGLAELHGALDDAQGKPDKTKYALMAQADARTPFPKMINSDTVPPMPYLPDFCAEGATVRVASHFPVSTQKIKYYEGQAAWPNPRCGKLRLAAGQQTTASSANGEIQFALQPGQALDLYLSSNTDVKHIGDFAQTWTLEESFKKQSETISTPIAATQSKVKAKISSMATLSSFGFKPSLALIAKPYSATKIHPNTPKIQSPAEALQAFVDGANAALTPYKRVRLVHATQVPEPGFNISLITADRKPDKTYAGIAVVGKVHGWSTSDVEFLATYSDDIDDINEPRRKTKSSMQNIRAFELSIPSIDSDPINDLRQTASQEFHDTKCHFVQYQMVAKSRYAQYFPEDWPVAGDASTLLTALYRYENAKSKNLVIVPSSSKPDGLPLEYVMPLFSWSKSANNSVRKGNQLRVYLRRPWFSTGTDEMLGVILNKDTGGANGDLKAHYATMIGSDPLFKNPAVNTIPSVDDFPNKAGMMQKVSIAEVPGASVDVAYFKPVFDDDQQLWYVDIEVNTRAGAYSPFIRLVLCRFQPHSVSGLECGPLVLSDISQLLPDRTAILTVVEAKKTVRVQVVGVAGQSAIGPNVVIATLEKKIGTSSNARWEEVRRADGSFYRIYVPVQAPVLSLAGPTAKAKSPIRSILASSSSSAPAAPARTAPVAATAALDQTAVEVTALPKSKIIGAALKPDGTMDLPDPSQVYRIVLREYERLTDTPPDEDNVEAPSTEAGRLVHVDVLGVP